MLTLERHRHILDLLETKGTVSLASLRREIDVTDMTLWRDLKALESQGRLRRVRGGAVRVDTAVEPAFGAKARLSLPAKRRIAQKAAETFVQPGDTLFLEGGTTVAELLRHLSAPRLSLITNSLPILARAHAGQRNLALQCSGGILSPVSGNFVGPDALEFFRRKRARTFFMSATGFDLETGQLSDPNPLEIEVKRAMASRAGSVVLLLDHSKFGLHSLESVLPIKDIDAIVTDSGITPAQRRQLCTLGPKILIA